MKSRIQIPRALLQERSSHAPSNSEGNHNLTRSYASLFLRLRGIIISVLSSFQAIPSHPLTSHNAMQCLDPGLPCALKDKLLPSHRLRAGRGVYHGKRPTSATPEIRRGKPACKPFDGQGREARLYARFYLVTAARNFKFARLDLGMGLDRSQSLKEIGKLRLCAESDMKCKSKSEPTIEIMRNSKFATKNFNKGSS